MTALRPPEYLPRLPYAALLLAADRVVLADTFRFSRQGGQNRARIRDSQGAQWLSVPRRHAGRPLALREVGVVDDGWRGRHARSVETAYRMAPYYEHLAPSLGALWDEPPASLADLTVRSVRWTARHLGATAEITLASDLPEPPTTFAGAWANLGGHLLTLPESADREAAHADAVHVLHVEEQPRRQVFAGFVPGLSVLDLLMTHGPASANLLREASTVHPFAPAPL